MNGDHAQHDLLIEIRSVEALIAFVALVRGKDVDAAQILAQMQLMKGATATLAESVKANTKP